jgi:hypothetical protein
MAWGKSTEDRESAAATELDKIEKAARVKWRREFAGSPIGRARKAYSRGDMLFQTSLGLDEDREVVYPLGPKEDDGVTRDPNDVLNGIDAEGWDLHSTGFVYLHEGGESEDRPFGNRRISIYGQVVGYYVFQRRDDDEDEED